MRRVPFAVTLLALGSFTLVSCTTPARTTMLGPTRPAITSADGVRVYQEPPRRFEEVAFVEGRSVAELRARAAEVGANGLLAGGIVQKPGPVIGIGLGTSSVRYGRRSAVGVGTGASFGIPTGSSVLTGTAIYVPRGR